MISLRYFQPAADLRRYVSSYYLFEADLPLVSDLVRADLAQIRFMLAGHGRYAFADTRGAAIPTPEISLIGPRWRRRTSPWSGPVRVFGIGLLPTGWAAGVREDASVLVHQIDDAAARFGPVFEDALDAMRGAPSAESMVSIADAVMRTVFDRAVAPPEGFTAMAEAWLTDSNSPTIDTLIARARELSGRQLERARQPHLRRAAQAAGAQVPRAAGRFAAVRSGARLVVDRRRRLLRPVAFHPRGEALHRPHPHPVPGQSAAGDAADAPAPRLCPPRCRASRWCGNRSQPSSQRRLGSRRTVALHFNEMPAFAGMTIISGLDPPAPPRHMQSD